jgi:AraC-like DNA-binding protein
MDVLSEVLRAVRLTGAVFFDLEQRAPWASHTPVGAAIATNVMPEAEHVIMFHAVTHGGLWAEVTDRSVPPLRAEAGDILVVPNADAHVLSSSPGMRVPPNVGQYYRPTDRQLPFLVGPGDGDGERTRLICGYLGCDVRPFNPVLQCLPRLLHIRAAESSGAITQLFRLAADETAMLRSGGELVLSKIAELMFVDVVRRYMQSLPPDSSGWLSGLRDPHVGAALALLHGRSGEAWTVETLARDVGLSRSAFAERFAHFVRETPIHYLTRWRMQLAARLLEQHGYSIAQIAAEVGYDSDAAFNRAFKKCTGFTPGAWRKARLGGEGQRMKLC